ncbi:hypothetical protein ESCO_004435 [Escovopsis weberi]|uniref:Uncharacterized protein n=1 Tax=Escovopsis weberi TaxID=150374 RepID=A0A0M9VVI3_ESCWE|nr:hypothetical protein ESCO_004435 [Escovopsis weberi]
MFMDDILSIRASLDIPRRTAKETPSSSRRSSIADKKASSPRPRPQVKAAACGRGMSLPQLKFT